MEVLARRYDDTVHTGTQVHTRERTGVLGGEGLADVLLEGTIGGEDVLGIVLSFDGRTTLLGKGTGSALEVIEESMIGGLGEHVRGDGKLVPTDDTEVKRAIGWKKLLSYREVITCAVMHEPRIGVLRGGSMIDKGGLTDGGVTHEEKVSGLGWGHGVLASVGPKMDLVDVVDDPLVAGMGIILGDLVGGEVSGYEFGIDKS